LNLAKYLLINLSQPLIFIAIVFLALFFNKLSINSLYDALLFSYLVKIIFAFLFSYKYLFRRKRIIRKELKILKSFAKNITPKQIPNLIFTQLDKLILIYFISPNDIGVYSIIQRYFLGIYSLLVSLDILLKPKLFEYYLELKKNKLQDLFNNFCSIYLISIIILLGFFYLSLYEILIEEIAMICITNFFLLNLFYINSKFYGIQAQCKNATLDILLSSVYSLLSLFFYAGAFLNSGFSILISSISVGISNIYLEIKVNKSKIPLSYNAFNIALFVVIVIISNFGHFIVGTIFAIISIVLLINQIINLLKKC